MDCKGSIECRRTGIEDLRCPSVMDIIRGHKGNAGMAMHDVVPVEEPPAESPGVLQGTETLGKLRTVFKRLELRFRIRIVIAYMGSAMGLGDTEIGEQKGHRLGFHAGSPVGVERELCGRDRLLDTGLANQLFGQRGRFPRGDHPADNIAAEHIKDDVEVKVRPLHRALQ